MTGVVDAAMGDFDFEVDFNLEVRAILWRKSVGEGTDRLKERGMKLRLYIRKTMKLSFYGGNTFTVIYRWAYEKGSIWHWAFNSFALIKKKKPVRTWVKGLVAWNVDEFAMLLYNVCRVEKNKESRRTYHVNVVLRVGIEFASNFEKKHWKAFFAVTDVWTGVSRYISLR
jgi:hypothetical protein